MAQGSPAGVARVRAACRRKRLNTPARCFRGDQAGWLAALLARPSASLGTGLAGAHAETEEGEEEVGTRRQGAGGGALRKRPGGGGWNGAESGVSLLPRLNCLRFFGLDRV